MESGWRVEGLVPTTTSEERIFFRNCFFCSTSRSQTFKVLVENLFVTIFRLIHFCFVQTGATFFDHFSINQLFFVNLRTTNVIRFKTKTRL